MADPLLVGADEDGAAPRAPDAGSSAAERELLCTAHVWRGVLSRGAMVGIPALERGAGSCANDAPHHLR